MARSVGEIAPGNRRIFEDEEDFYIGDLALYPFSIPHDAADPVGFRVFYGGRSVATATDMGCMKKSVVKALSGVDILLLESNHDPDLLMLNPHYSLYLKQRILGNHGHLSNLASAEGLLELMNTGVREVMLGHLSGENNTPVLARQVSERAMLREGIRPGEDIQLQVALRDETGDIFILKETD
jgi:phosphoribosyl 1,2-cyclic phosphodiesterase